LSNVDGRDAPEQSKQSGTQRGIPLIQRTVRRPLRRRGARVDGRGSTEVRVRPLRPRRYMHRTSSPPTIHPRRTAMAAAFGARLVDWHVGPPPASAASEIYFFRVAVIV
jgi:hypothetical protein